MMVVANSGISAIESVSELELLYDKCLPVTSLAVFIVATKKVSDELIFAA
jgi:hypothetical protein